jgi:glycosyltransferase involved in cell wall biosynthesis
MHSSFIPAGIALLGSQIPMIASEHAPPVHYKNHKIQNLLLNITPLISNKIIVVSEQILTSYRWWLRKNMQVIFNPVTIDFVKFENHSKDITSTKKIILSVGRLGPEKNHSCLISAFAIVSPFFLNWHLRIVGDGILRKNLENQIITLGLQNKITLTGSLSDISAEYLNADLFVTTSLYESFGLATVEALLHGLPAVGFSDCQGTNLMIIHQVNGILVSGKDRILSLANVLQDLMGNEILLNRLSNASIDSISKIYNIDSVLDSWENLFFDIRYKN